MLVSLAFIGAVATNAGVEFGSDEKVGLQQILNGVFVVLALAPLVAAVVVGIFGWVRRRSAVALVVAVLSAITIVIFVVFPSLG